MEIIDRKVYTTIFHEMAIFCFINSTFEIYLMSTGKPKQLVKSLEDIENHRKENKESNMYAMFIGEIKEDYCQVKYNDQIQHDHLGWT
jgi:hypothetical protein